MTRGIIWLVRMLLILFVLHLVFARESRAQSVDKNGFIFDLSAVPISQVVSLYYKEVVKTPYVICADVLGDARPVSLRVQGKALDAVMISTLLDAYGYAASVENGVTVICKKPEQIAQQDDFSATVVFRPQFREVGYLVDLLSPLVRGVFANRRTSAPVLAVGGADTNPGSSATSSSANSTPTSPSNGSTYRSNTGDDFLLFSGSEKQADKLRNLLAQLDVPTGEVLIKGHVYEVGTSETDQAALDIFLSALKGKVQVDIAGPVLGNALRIKTAALDVVASAIKTDSRFKLVTSPYARVRSGSTARFMSGADVPVLGSIVTNSTGQT